MDATSRQGSHHYVLTLQKPLQHLPGAPVAFHTATGTITPPPDWTRADFLDQLYQDVTRTHPELASATVLFFTVDRNQL